MTICSFWNLLTFSCVTHGGIGGRAGIGIPKYRKYREIPKFGIPKYRKFESRNFQYYWIPKILNTEFSILLNTEKYPIPNFNIQDYYRKYRTTFTEKKEILFLKSFEISFYLLLVFLVSFDIFRYFSVFIGIEKFWYSIVLNVIADMSCKQQYISLI